MEIRKGNASAPLLVEWGIDDEDFQRLSEALLELEKPVAQAVANDLMEQIAQDDESVSFDGLRDLRIFTADVEDNIEKLDGQIRHLRCNGRNTIPCGLVDKALIPLSTEELWRQREAEAEQYSTLLETTLPIGEALSNAGRQLARFLANRLVSRYFPIKGFAGGMSHTPNLLSVEVESYTTGARVSYSPAYFISYIALAAPTSPVHGWLLPGRYVFSLTTPGPRVLVDQQAFDIPPVFRVSLMI